MKKIIIFGNSGSGKSTYAKQRAQTDNLEHFDLDTVAWQDCVPPQRRPLAESAAQIKAFTEQHDHWVIEGCYSDLIELVIPEASEVIFLNLPVAQCLENARQRPWEPHKYVSKQAQDANLDMLLDWIRAYPERQDSFSKAAHTLLFESFKGPKSMYTSNIR